MLTGAFPSPSGRSLFDWKNKRGNEESAYGTAAEIAGLPAPRTCPTTARPRESASAGGQTTFRQPSNRPRSIVILNRQPSREKPTTFRSAPNPSQRLPDKPGARLRHVSALPVAGSALGRRNPRARTLRSPSASVTRSCFCRPCPSPARAALPSASGFGRFPPFAGERKTLTNPLTL